MADKVVEPGWISWVQPTYLGLTWENNRLPTPWQEIDLAEFLRLTVNCQASLLGINFNQVWLGGSSYDPMWAVRYFFYPSYALAVASQYQQGHADYAVFLPDRPAALTGEDQGYAVRFFRIGCQHPQMQDTFWTMHERGVSCPDCGYVGRFDTSG